MVLVLKHPPVNARDVRDAGSIPGPEYPMEESMATHSSTLAWKIPMERGACRATAHRVTKSQTRLKQLSLYALRVQEYQVH